MEVNEGHLSALEEVTQEFSEVHLICLDTPGAEETAKY